MIEHIRLLLCHTCKSLEELPDYQGNPENDRVLDVMVSRHRFPDGNEHFGQLIRLEKRHWDNLDTKAEIKRQIFDNAGWTGLDPEFYEVKNNLKEDALACWQKHLRTPDCNDYKSASKELKPNTQAARKELGMPKYEGPKRYLCEHCPVHSLVQQAARARAGLYN